MSGTLELSQKDPGTPGTKGFLLSYYLTSQESTVGIPHCKKNHTVFPTRPMKAAQKHSPVLRQLSVAILTSRG